MKHLLDVNVLLAAIWATHSDNGKTLAWLEDKPIALCPLTELGFLRISTNQKFTFGATMDKARNVLETFKRERKADWIADDLAALDSFAKTSNQVTDSYLADLAEKHGFKLATLDTGIKHRAVELIR
jgi:toxin-antitoxin system PIN domain toxin